MDQQIAIDRILETENLTDGLEDNDARWLLDWGIARLPTLIDKTEDEDAAGAKVNDLMVVMRKVNQIISARGSGSAEDLAVTIQELNLAISRLFGRTRALSSKNALSLANSLQTGTPRQAMQSLIEAMQPVD